MLKSLAFLIVILVGGSQSIAQVGTAKPNFVVIIADDMGWYDCGAYGHPSIKTPHIDQLAKAGLRFDNAYLTTSSCSPSRASIMTSRYPHNTGAQTLHSQMDASAVLVSTPLREAGYYTAVAGKWHLGENVRNQFDAIYGGNPGGEEKWIEALQKRPKEKPFFFWLASMDPHRDYGGKGAAAKIHQPSDVVVPPYYPDVPEVRKDFVDYYDEIARLDSYVGKVREELKSQGVEENTVIVFLTDNGRPFPRCKTRITDEGIQTPFIVTWPSRVQPGQTTSSLISSIDLAPTMLELAGAKIPETFQGKSFAPILEDPVVKTREYIFAEHNWHDYNAFERAVRNERYTYIRNELPALPKTPPADAVRSPTHRVLQQYHAEGKLQPWQVDPFETPGPPEFLFDNELDPYSLDNLIESPAHHAVLETLRKELAHWQQQTGDVFDEAKLLPDKYDRGTGRLPEKVE
jgi:N-sulfoglucosamine sulfohydrolase